MTTYYPSQLACRIETSNGAVFLMRPIRPDDGAKLAELHRSLSARSVYRRFFFVHPTLTDREIERFTCVDYVDRMALVVVDGAQLVAVGRYDRSPDTTEAEVAFVVADAHQHVGLATLLLEHLADAAWRNGVETFTALTMVENREMQQVFRHSGFPVSRSVEMGIVNIRFSIEPNEASRAQRRSRRGALGSVGSSFARS